MKKGRKSGPNLFYIVLAAVAVIGAGFLLWMATRSTAPVATAVEATPAKAEGYLYGNPNAPVSVYEFADFECPGCGRFATVTEPDVRKRILDAGIANLRYFDFPLEMHQNTIPASNAAACAADQNKFWQMHDKLFFGQPDWNGQATRNPKKIFEGYAKELGLDMEKWNGCYDRQDHLQRILSNRAEAIRRGVGETPTFIIGNRRLPGPIAYDVFKAYVDSAAKLAPASPAAAKPADSTRKGAAR